jgi:hypothetical protein
MRSDLDPCHRAYFAPSTLSPADKQCLAASLEGVA